ncbi:MAG TPA: MarR family transcriptional regulator [Mycobacteriales bacterium]|nr:MarR family transcriptional regulator [Mycobacteriales bacterium]
MTAITRRPAVPRTPVGPPDDEALAEVVARLRRALRRSVRPDLPAEALQVAHIELLQSLADEPGLRASDLAQRLLLAPTTVSTLIGQLLDRGCLERRPHAQDRRAWNLHLTPLGRRRLGDWQRATRRALALALAQIGPDERDAIRAATPALGALATRLGVPPAPEAR